MLRNPAELGKHSFDLLVIGAGIYGATIAWDASLRGLSVALIDKGDFGAATSANSLKTVHGGLRSLQRASLGEMRSFIRERRALLRVAPHLVHPIQFAIPTTRKLSRHPLVMRAALAVNDAFAADRNRGLDPARRLGRSRVVSKNEFFSWEPGIDSSAVAGGAVWFDAQMFSSDRLLLAFVQSAVEKGAVAVNHVEAVSLLTTGNRVRGAALRDSLTGKTLEVEARVVVNAAGAWAEALSATAGREVPAAPVRFAKALNLVTSLPAPPLALGATYQGRFYFRVPWRGVSIFGTSQDVFDDEPDNLRATEDDVARLLANVNAAFPGASARPGDVTLVHRGLLPRAGVAPDGEALLAKKSLVRDHRKNGVEGLVTVVGVRYTTARETAAQTVDLAFNLLGRTPPSSTSDTTPLAGGDVDSVERLLAAAAADSRDVLSPRAAERIARAYGSRYRSILRIVDRDPALARPLGGGEGDGVTAAEVVHAVEEEMAVTLADALARRTEAGAAGWPGDAVVDDAARLMAKHLGWDADHTRSEVSALRAMYP